MAATPRCAMASPNIMAIRRAMSAAASAPSTKRCSVGMASLPPDLRQPALPGQGMGHDLVQRSEEHTSELQSLMRTSYAVFCLKKKKKTAKAKLSSLQTIHHSTPTITL